MASIENKKHRDWSLSEAGERARNAVQASIVALVIAQGSQKEFAERVGTTQGNVSHWMKGTSTPTIDKLAEIAEAYNLPISSLVEFDAEGEPMALMPDEVELLHAYRGLETETKKAVLEVMRACHA